MNEWKDITSYRRSEPQPRTPRVLRIELDTFEVTIVTGHLHYDPGTWLVQGDITGERELAATDVDSAKREALGLAVSRLRDAYAAAQSALKSLETVSK